VDHHRRVDGDRLAVHERAALVGDVVREQGIGEAVAEEVHLPVSGSILGWAVMAVVSRPAKSQGPTVDRSSGASW
jgi:hypothetical protein